MHRDLKPENILINNGILKISDFGLSKKVFDRVSKQTHVGTPYYMSLELLMGNSYSSKCDIWSLGCIFYEMLHGKTPWTGNTEYDLIMNIHHKPLNISP
jgi:serine/threonine protein kinase